jgi:hypothetical protein
MKILLAVLFLSISSLGVYAQSNVQEDIERSRTIGISASFQGGQFDIMLPIWLSPSFVLAPIVGILHASEIGTDISFGLMPKIYLRNEKIAPFIGARIGMIANLPASTEVNKIDLIGGVSFGAEYFFDPRFSIGVEAQGNITKSHANSSRFGNPGNLNFNTATALIASIYF